MGNSLTQINMILA